MANSNFFQDSSMTSSKIKVCFLLFLVLQTLLVNAQVTFVKQKNVTPYFTEYFKAPDTNNSFRHGNYEKVVDGDLVEKGQYHLDIQTGIWEYYDYRKLLTLKYDFSSKSLLFALPPKDNTCYIKLDSGWVEVTPERSLYLLGSWFEVYRNISKQVTAPSAFLKSLNPSPTKAVIGIIVNEEGQTQGYKILTASDYSEWDRQLLKTLKAMTWRNNWLPTIYKEKPVTSIYKCIFNLVMN